MRRREMNNSWRKLSNIRNVTAILLMGLMLSVPAHTEENNNILQVPSVKLTKEKLEGIYDLHLYFGNTKPYLDSVEFKQGAAENLSGIMHVPNDFDATLEKLVTNDTSIRFEVLVPANASRPQDMIFLYEATISPHDTSKFSGHVTLTKVGNDTLPTPEYVASFLMFKKEVP